MKIMRIRGGQHLVGNIAISGAKNAALPALAACLLTGERMLLHRIPDVVDIRTMSTLIANIGADLALNANSCTIQAHEDITPVAPYELVKTMRASSLVLGPLTARCGRARVSLPGGCAIGARPIDMHLNGLKTLGAEIRQDHGYIEAMAPRSGLRGGRIQFQRPTVTGTEDLLMAAVLAKGPSVLENAAREPEVVDTANLLTRMGAKIEGAGTSTIEIEGVDTLHGAEYSIIPDRIETGTYLVAGAMLGDNLTLTGTQPEHLEPVIERVVHAGGQIEIPDERTIIIQRGNPLSSIDITTREHPGFPTDMQAQFMAMMTQSNGTANIVETIFENRFMHASELERMGARIKVVGNLAMVTGKTTLTGTHVMASDLRASACLVLAALVARGETTIHRVYHLERGYEKMAEKLCAVGADIQIAYIS